MEAATLVDKPCVQVDESPLGSITSTNNAQVDESPWGSISSTNNAETHEPRVNVDGAGALAQVRGADPGPRAATFEPPLRAATQSKTICDVCAGDREQRNDVCAGAVNNAQNERAAGGASDSPVPAEVEEPENEDARAKRPDNGGCTVSTPREAANAQSHVVEGATPRSGGAPSISTCWVVHSGYDHGDVPLLRNHNLQVLHDECWFDYGDAHKGDHRLRRLKREKPDLVIIHMADVKKTAQPKVSFLTMLEQVSEVVQEQLKSKRDAIVYGFKYERQLWAARDEPERRGSPNWGLTADEEHPLFPLHSLVCVGVGDSPVARGTLGQYLVRQFQFGVVGPETGMPSNKLVRVLSSLSLGKEAKPNCGCGAAGKRHFERGKNLSQCRIVEPKNYPMRILFLKHLLRSICKVFNAGELPLRSRSSSPPWLLAQRQGLGTHPECSPTTQTVDNVDSGQQETTSRGRTPRGGTGVQRRRQRCPYPLEGK